MIFFALRMFFSFAELLFLGQYFVMMSPSDVTNSSSASQRSVSHLPLCSRPTVMSNIVRDDRRRQTHKEGTTVWCCSLLTCHLQLHAGPGRCRTGRIHFLAVTWTRVQP